MTQHSDLPPLGKTADSIKSLFDRIAPVYDEFNEQLSFGLHRIWKQMAVDWSRAKTGQTVLDLCCGSGDLVFLLARRVGKMGRVIGVDFSSAQLAIAQQKARQAWNLPSLEWVEADVLALPFEDASFDAATMAFGLRNLVDIPQGLAELRRVLRPQAHAAILDFHLPTNDWMRRFQQWYLGTVVVPTAKQRDLTAEYAYIGPSVDRFPQGKQQVELSYQAGFANAVHYEIAGGLMGVLVVTR